MKCRIADGIVIFSDRFNATFPLAEILEAAGEREVIAHFGTRNLLGHMDEKEIRTYVESHLTKGGSDGSGKETQER